MISPYISICIPAYKNVGFLKRLLDSISVQSFQDYEVIVTDDSPDRTVQDFIFGYTSLANIRYFKNQPALGTPENWNEGIKQARGKWIKLMHNDDWFNGANALEVFYSATQDYSSCSFFFSAFQNITEETRYTQVVKCNWFDCFFLRLNSLHLFRRVYVGNPSCTLMRSDIDLLYDKRFKYVVDFEYYIRCLKKTGSFHYINAVLLNIGFHKEQVTKYTFLVPEVQIPENHLLLEKFGNKILKNILVYDYYWRMYRNLNIRSVEEVKRYYTQPVNLLLQQMLIFQGRVPYRFLKVGIISKSLMFISFMISYLKND